MADFRSNFRPRLLLAAAFGLIALLVGWDLASDRSAGVDTLHVVIESVILVTAAVSMLVLIGRDWRQRRRLHGLSANLERARRESARWRARYQGTIDGLARAIQVQFRDWNLTDAESEIGLLLLKGLGLKQIAALRGTSERTVREQARGLYRKAGVEGRAGLSAFFLEDLLLPGNSGPPRGPE